MIQFILGRKPRHGYIQEMFGNHSYVNADLWRYEPYTPPTFIGVKWYPWKIIVGILAVLGLDFFSQYIHSDSFANSIHGCVSFTGRNISSFLAFTGRNISSFLVLTSIILLVMSLVHLWKKFNINQIVRDFIRTKKDKYCQPIKIVDDENDDEDEDEEEKVENGSID